MKTSRIANGIAVALASLPTPLMAADEGTTPLFTVNLGTSFWTAVVFFALLAVLWKFAWGPILQAVNDREAGIQSALDEAAARQAEARELLEEHRARMADARREAQQIIAEAKEAGQKVREEIEEKARAESQGMLERARGEIEREKEAAVDELRKESVEIALSLASKLLQENLDADKDRELIMEYMNRLGGDSRGAEA